MVKKMKGLKGISPVIAAVILIAVAIAVGVMVSTWVTSWVTTTTGGAGGTASSCVGISYTVSFISNSSSPTAPYWIMVKVTNTGTSDVTLSGMEVSSATATNSSVSLVNGAQTISPQRSVYLNGTWSGTPAVGDVTSVKVFNDECPSYSSTATVS